MCTFTPNLANESRKISRRLEFEPIHVRYAEEFKMKERRLEEKRIQQLTEVTQPLPARDRTQQSPEFHF